MLFCGDWRHLQESKVVVVLCGGKFLLLCTLLQQLKSKDFLCGQFLQCHIKYFWMVSLYSPFWKSCQ